MPAEPAPLLQSPAPQLGRALQPSFGAGSVLSRTFAIWWENALVFSGVALLLHSPALLGTVLLGPPVAGNTGTEVARTVLGLVSMLLNVLVSGALTYGVIQSLRGQPVRFGEILGVGARRFWRISGVSIGVFVISMVLAILLLVPGIMAMCALMLAVPAAVVEPDRPALRRSRELTKGHRGTIFLVLLVFLLIGMVAGGVAGFANVFAGGIAGGTAVLLFVQVVTIVTSGLGSTWPAIAYHDLRVEKEGVDTAELARVFE